MAITTLYKAEKPTSEVKPALDIKTDAKKDDTAVSKDTITPDQTPGAEDSLTIGGEKLNLITDATVVEEEEDTAPVNPDEASVSAESGKGTTEEVDNESEEEPEWFKKRMAKITWQKNEETRRAEEAEAKAKHYESLMRDGKLISTDTTAPAVPPAPVVEDKAPKLEDFTDINDFVKASVAHEIKKVESNKTQESQVAKAVEEQTKLVNAFAEKESTFTQRTPDYHQVVHDPKLAISFPVASFIQRSEKGPELAYILAKNPAVLVKLNQMNPIDMIRNLVTIEGNIKSPETKQKTTAPKPIKTVSGKGTDIPGTKDILKMSSTELLEHFRKEDRVKREKR